jgi:hypothetical protein
VFTERKNIFKDWSLFQKYILQLFDKEELGERKKKDQGENNQECLQRNGNLHGKSVSSIEIGT